MLKNKVTKRSWLNVGTDIGLAVKDFKETIKYMFKKLKQVVMQISQQMGNFNRKKNYKRKPNRNSRAEKNKN